MSVLLKRTFLNPTLAITGGLSFVSGVLMFFKIKSFIIVPTHEWVSMVFLVACALHLLLNWKPLLHSLKGRPMRWSVLGVLMLSLVVMLYSTTLPQPPRTHGAPPAAQVSQQ